MDIASAQPAPVTLSPPSKYTRHPDDEKKKPEKPYHNSPYKCSFVEVSFEDLVVEWRHGGAFTEKTLALVMVWKQLGFKC
jgi:hypothetical protein